MFYDVVARRPSFHTHAVDWYLRILPLLGLTPSNNFDWLPVRAHVIDTLRRKWPVESRDWVILQPGARWLNKRWPVQHFTELVRSLSKKFPSAHFVILGGKDEAPLGETILQASPERCLNLCGATSLPEMVEWIRLCDLMITNDTGPMHVAAALGKPLIALFGPTEPRRTGPYGQLENVLHLDLPCSPCLSSRCAIEETDKCLRALSPAMVVDRVEKLFVTRR